jgi:hypothetical protein
LPLSPPLSPPQAATESAVARKMNRVARRVADEAIAISDGDCRVTEQVPKQGSSSFSSVKEGQDPVHTQTRTPQAGADARNREASHGRNWPRVLTYGP